MFAWRAIVLVAEIKYVVSPLFKEMRATSLMQGVRALIGFEEGAGICFGQLPSCCIDLRVGGLTQNMRIYRHAAIRIGVHFGTEETWLLLCV
jgi:hypothetical protein